MSYEFDAAIVLACGINRDGSLPDDPKESVDIASHLYTSGRTPLIIFSGNLSYKADFIPPQSEADAMVKYAQEIGLPGECLLKESESKDTLGNAYFTKVHYLISRHLGRLSVILGPNHSLRRVKFIFDKVLGDQYDTTFFEHNANRDGETEREEKSLDILKEWLSKIPNGDHEAVHQVMLAKHPGYSSSPDKAWKNLNKRLQK
jgi:uncharacterized SAM-binding protein YcdF (DUF218 family)